MAKQFPELNSDHIEFIKEQKMFFVGTAASTGSINISPKGMDSFRVIDSQTVAWLNLTGSGNETSAHVQQYPRMTIMFCAFSGAPNILRLYGTAQVIHPEDNKWQDYHDLFPSIPGARQVFLVKLERVLTSCGFSVPLYSYEGERGTLENWAAGKSPQQLKDYWLKKNQLSLDGFDTNIRSLNKIADDE